MPQDDASRYIAPRAKRNPDVVINDCRQASGRIITFGDIHGSPVFRTRVLSALGQQDRVVLVGDLIDRGKDSFTVVKTRREDERFMAVRGNHEESFLQYFRIRKNLSNEGQTLLAKLGDGYSNEQLEACCNTLTKKPYHLNSTHEEQLWAFLYNGGGWAQNKSIEELKPLATYVDALPYIRQVQTAKGDFLVGHADVSILNDEVLKEFYSNPEKRLSVAQKAHIIWARAADIKKGKFITTTNPRTKDSLRTYVGHEIVTREGIQVCRPETNHCNLDFGACYDGALVGVDHPDKVVVFGHLSPQCRQKDKEQFYTQLHALNANFTEIEFDSIAGLQQYQTYLLNKKLKPNNNAHVRLTQAQFNQDFNSDNLRHFKNAVPSGVSLTQDQFNELCTLNKIHFKNAVLSGVSLTQDQFNKLCKWEDIHLFCQMNVSDKIQITESQFCKLYNAEMPESNNSDEQSRPFNLCEVIALHKEAPLLRPKQRLELLRAQHTVNNSTNSGNVSHIINDAPFLNAMDAAIASCGQSGDLGKEKNQTLQALRDRYAELVTNSEDLFLDPSAASEYANTLIKTFVTVAATARSRKYGWMTAQFGDTKSVNAFHEAIKNDSAALEELHQALGTLPSEGATSNKRAQFKQFKTCLETMKTTEQVPYQQEIPTLTNP